MKKEEKFITVNHLDDYSPMGYTRFRVGQQLKLQKEKDNCYDDEAISVFSEKGCRCGYVANSVHTTARGTFSAGRLYDKFVDEASARVLFVMPETVIAEVWMRKGKGNGIIKS